MSPAHPRDSEAGETVQDHTQENSTSDSDADPHMGAAKQQGHVPLLAYFTLKCSLRSTGSWSPKKLRKHVAWYRNSLSISL